MTTLAEVIAKEAEADDAEALLSEYIGAIPSPEHTALQTNATLLRSEATDLRAQYQNQEQLEHTQISNNFDLDSSESFFIAEEFGSLRGADGTGTAVEVDLTNLDDPKLDGAFFKTHEGTRYLWTDGNTYTFGGSKDYSYGNAYEVGISESDDDTLTYWDGDFPFDIVSPTSAGSSVDTTDYKSDFDGVPDAYKLLLPILTSTELKPPSFVPDDNAVSKNVGHTYEYQLGDTYSIQLSKNTNEVTLTDSAYGYENIGVKKSSEIIGASLNSSVIGDVSSNEEIATQQGFSFVGFNFGLDTGIVDVGASVKGIEVEVAVSGVKLETANTLVHFSYEYTGVKVTYENALKTYEIMDRPEFKISDENIKVLTSQKIESVAGVGIVFQVDTEDKIMDWPDKVLGKGKTSAVVEAIPIVGPIYAWYRALVGILKKSEVAFDSQVKLTDFNEVREDNPPVPVSTPPREGYTRVDINTDSVGLVSYAHEAIAAVAYKAAVPAAKAIGPIPAVQAEPEIQEVKPGPGISMAEFILSSKLQLAEVNVRDKASTLASKIKNITQKADLKKQAYFVTNYTSATNYSQFWLTNLAPVPAIDEMTINSAGLLLKKTADNFTKFKLDTETNKAELLVQKDATNKIEQTLDAAAGKYNLAVNTDVAKIDVIKDKMTLSVKQAATSVVLNKDDITLTSKTAKIEPATSATIKSSKVTVDSNDITLGKCTISPTEMKIPKGTVTVGQGATTLKVTPVGIELKGTKVGFVANAMIQMTGGIIKLG